MTSQPDIKSPNTGHRSPATDHPPATGHRPPATRILGDGVLIALGVLSAGFGLEGFLLPNSFIDGGVMGISLLVAAVTTISLPILVFALNVPFIALGYRQISREFAIKTFCGIVALALVLAVLKYPVVTNDKVLIAIFGGFFLGLGIGLCVRGGGVIDGTEVLALYISRRASVTIGDVILVFNILIFITAALVFNIETALYSILTYLAASRTVDFVVQGIEEYTGVTIVSKRSDEIREAIIEQLGRGVTSYKGTKGFGKRGHTQDVDIIFTVVTRLEIVKLKELILHIDDSAFVVQASINDTIGGMVKRRSLSQ